MCDTPTLVVIDEADTDRLLRVLYNGTRPAKVHTLVCLCGAIADLRESPKAWNGWQVLPNARCPICLQTAAEGSAEAKNPNRARARFQIELSALQGQKGSQ